jgi:hypothetical protein
VSGFNDQDPRNRGRWVEAETSLRPANRDTMEFL